MATATKSKSRKVVKKERRVVTEFTLVPGDVKKTCVKYLRSVDKDPPTDEFKGKGIMTGSKNDAGQDHLYLMNQFLEAAGLQGKNVILTLSVAD